MRPSPWRANVLFGCLVLALGLLSARLVTMMLRDRAAATAKALRQQRRTITIPGRPGGIYARSGDCHVPLAVSRQVPSCYADPSLIADSELDDVAIEVGDATGLNAADVQLALLERRDRQFAWLKRDLPAHQAEAIEALGLRAVGVQPEWRREYPNRDLAAAVVGFRRIDGAGGGGMELGADGLLAAHDGRRVVLTDAARRPIWPLPDGEVLPRDGQNVFLFIDAVIQAELEDALRQTVEKYSAKWATGVVVDPFSGAVLAMASLPTFDPNEYSTASPEAMTNRAITVPFEPGSVFKPIVVAGAVEAGVTNYQEEIFCENGTYHAPGGGTITDHGESYGHLTVADGVVHSSNICMAKVGEKLGNDAIHEVVGRFGFGRQTGIRLPGESAGILRPLAKWDGYSMRRVPFGQEISATTLQVAMAFCALSNGGVLLRPRMIDAVCSPEGEVVYQSRREVVRRAISPQTAAQALAVLEQVVLRGGIRRYAPKNWRSFGKTGTAQIAGVGGYVDGAFVGSFVGGAPVARPRLICMISVYWPDRGKGHFGATVAAPYVMGVLDKSLTYLQVPPDAQDQSPTRLVAADPHGASLVPR